VRPEIERRRRYGHVEHSSSRISKIGWDGLLATLPNVIGLALSPDERQVAVGDRTGGLHLLAVDGTSSRLLPGPPGRLRMVTFSRDGTQLAGGGDDGLVVLWDLARGTARALPARRGQVTTVAFSRDGRWLAASTATGDVGLWDVATLAERPLQAPGPVVTVGFLGDDLVTGGADATVRVWRAADGSQRALLRVDAEVATLVVGETGLVASSVLGTMVRWPLSALGAAPPQAPAPLAPFLAALSLARLDEGGTLTSLP
jgi:WD40 repeat protein